MKLGQAQRRGALCRKLYARGVLGSRLAHSAGRNQFDGRRSEESKGPVRDKTSASGSKHRLCSNTCRPNALPLCRGLRRKQDTTTGAHPQRGESERRTPTYQRSENVEVGRRSPTAC